MTAGMPEGAGVAQALVSVCIPTFNNASMIADALRSALQQTYENLEIVVLDNDSADDTEGVVRATAGQDPRFRYVRHPKNIGMAGNFNHAVSTARGELVLILCADDMLERNCIDVLAAALGEHPEAVLAAGARTIVDSSMRPMRVSRPRASRELVSGRRLTEECFSRGNIVGEPSAVIFRRAAAQRGFDAAYHQFIDVEMWVHLLGRGSAVLLPDTVSRIRRHGGQWSEANIRNGRLVSDKQAFFRKLAPELAPRLTTLQKLRWDARMCSSAAKTVASGAAVDVRAIKEVFFPTLFRCASALTAGIMKLAG
jgi:glycosyltransferase involved in cell wall biosynthesis